MSIVSLVMALGLASFGASSISGQIVDTKGAAVTSAKVFLEPNVAAPLVQTVSGADGAFRFDDVPNETVGVFAIAPGFGFGGATFKVTSNTDIQGTKIRLAPPATIGGKITDAKGHAVKGARITRVALLGESKVGVPLAKLKAAGFEEPVSDEKGKFVVEDLPEGGTVALKVSHRDYAQAAVEDIRVGDEGVTVKLSPGIPLEGEVLSRGTQTPVADVMVMIRNAQPPHDTATVGSDFQGHFSLRVNPGVYMCQAAGAGFASPGWEKIVVKGDVIPRVKIYTAGMGKIEGKVCDAVTGKPVVDARIQLETEGNAAAAARTGTTGEFSIAAMAGTNVVRLQPAPGYLAPEQPPLNFQVVEEKTVTLPTFWLAPIPAYSVLVVDGNDKPVPGAVLTVLSPQQFGWQVADAAGKAVLSFGAWPASGSVIGLAEHPREPLGALFALDPHSRSQAQLGNEKLAAKVQLFPLGSVKGRAVSAKGKAVEGAMVASVVGEEGIPLWRTITGPDGTFRWNAVIPQVPQQCVIAMNDEAHSEPQTFSVDVGGIKDLGDMTLGTDPAASASLLGKPLAWNKNPLIGGALPGDKTLHESTALVIYCRAADAPMVIEALAAAPRACPDTKIVCAAVVDGHYDPKNPPIPVLSGKAPGPASTYVVDASGAVTLETFGLPPLRAFLHK